MTPQRDHYHNLNTQIPDVIWDAIVADAEKRGESVARILAQILQAHYQISSGKMPKPKPPGRKPKKRH